MRSCPSCGREANDGRDYCTCGEYLRWEPTRHVRAVTPHSEPTEPAAPKQATAPAAEPLDPHMTAAPAAGRPRHQVTLAPAGPRAILKPLTADAIPKSDAPPKSSSSPRNRSAATLVLRLPDGDPLSDKPVTTSVKTGERTSLIALVRNNGDVVDNYQVTVRGLPESWWTVSPSTVYLVPYGADDSYEQEVVVELHPPRTPNAYAKEWELEVVAVSRASETVVASERATLRIEPYDDLVAKIVPDRASGRLKARLVVTVRNRANASTVVRLDAQDAEGECRFRFAQPSITIEPGKGVEAPVTVFPPKQIWLGRAKDRALTVSATPVDAGAPAAVLTATYRQRAWLPWWLSLVATAVCAVVAVVLLLLPKQVTVPNVKHSASVFAAEKIAIHAGLTLSTQVTPVPNSTVKPGAIVDQTPEPGTKAKLGTAIHVEVAVGSNMTKVPPIVGSTSVAADGTLRAAHLVLGTVNPQPDPNAQITTQIPSAGAMVADGTPVNVYVETSSSSSTSANSTSRSVVLPALTGATAAAAAQQLRDLGFTPKSVLQFSSEPKGQLISTNPSSGSSLLPGATIQLNVSAGYPDISYDDGSQVQVVDGATGNPAGSNPPNPPTDEATWSPDGSELVYVQGVAANSGQLMLFMPNEQGAQPVALTGPGSNVRDPAFAPNGQVLAFIDRSQGFGRLCFATVSTSTVLNTNNCTSHAGYDLGASISWSRDGKSILVFGVDRSDPSQYGLIIFGTSVAFSPNAAVWGLGNLATAGQNVIAGAFSPDGQRVALVSDFNQSAFHIFIAPANTFDVTKATMTLGQACQVSWRSDSQALAVTQGSSCIPDSSGQYPTGNIFTFTLADPHQLTQVGYGAENPSWQPLSLSG